MEKNNNTFITFNSNNNYQNSITIFNPLLIHLLFRLLSQVFLQRFLSLFATMFMKFEVL